MSKCLSCSHIKNRIRHYLIDGEVIRMDNGIELRWLDRGQEFEDEHVAYAAMEAGVYSTEYGGRWMYIGDFQTIEQLYFDPMIKDDPIGFEGWGWGVMASKALRAMNPVRN